MNPKFKFLYLILALLVVYTVWIGSTNDGDTPPPRWEILVDEQGQLEVFGVKLGHHTLLEAEQILHSRSLRALFIRPNEGDQPGKLEVEAYFSNMPDNSKLLLGLAAAPEQLEQIKQRAHDPMAFPSGNIKLKIADNDMPLLDGMKVDMLTSIPRIRISPNDIQAQFGEPAMIHQDGDVLHFLYPEKGLDAILDNSGEAIIQFVNPNNFKRVLDSLGLTEQQLQQTTSVP